MNSLLTHSTQGCEALCICNTSPSALSRQTTINWKLSSPLWMQWFCISHFWLIMHSGTWFFFCVCVCSHCMLSLCEKQHRKYLLNDVIATSLIAFGCNYMVVKFCLAVRLKEGEKQWCLRFALKDGKSWLEILGLERKEKDGSSKQWSER